MRNRSRRRSIGSSADHWRASTSRRRSRAAKPMFRIFGSRTWCMAGSYAPLLMVPSCVGLISAPFETWRGCSRCIGTAATSPLLPRASTRRSRQRGRSPQFRNGRSGPPCRSPRSYSTGSLPSQVSGCRCGTISAKCPLARASLRRATAANIRCTGPLARPARSACSRTAR